MPVIPTYQKKQTLDIGGLTPSVFPTGGEYLGAGMKDLGTSLGQAMANVQERNRVADSKNLQMNADAAATEFKIRAMDIRGNKANSLPGLWDETHTQIKEDMFAGVADDKTRAEVERYASSLNNRVSLWTAAYTLGEIAKYTKATTTQMIAANQTAANDIPINQTEYLEANVAETTQSFAELNTGVVDAPDIANFEETYRNDLYVSSYQHAFMTTPDLAVEQFEKDEKRLELTLSPKAFNQIAALYEQEYPRVQYGKAQAYSLAEPTLSQDPVARINYWYDPKNWKKEGFYDITVDQAMQLAAREQTLMTFKYTQDRRNIQAGKQATGEAIVAQLFPPDGSPPNLDAIDQILSKDRYLEGTEKFSWRQSIRTFNYQVDPVIQSRLYARIDSGDIGEGDESEIYAAVIAGGAGTSVEPYRSHLRKTLADKLKYGKNFRAEDESNYYSWVSGYQSPKVRAMLNEKRGEYTSTLDSRRQAEGWTVYDPAYIAEGQKLRDGYVQTMQLQKQEDTYLNAKAAKEDTSQQINYFTRSEKYFSTVVSGETDKRRRRQLETLQLRFSQKLSQYMMDNGIGKFDPQLGDVAMELLQESTEEFITRSGERVSKEDKSWFRKEIPQVILETMSKDGILIKAPPGVEAPLEEKPRTGLPELPESIAGLRGNAGFEALYPAIQAMDEPEKKSQRNSWLAMPTLIPGTTTEEKMEVFFFTFPEYERTASTEAIVKAKIGG